MIGFLLKVVAAIEDGSGKGRLPYMTPAPQIRFLGMLAWTFNALSNEGSSEGSFRCNYF